MKLKLWFLLVCSPVISWTQGLFPHPNAHAHNDYEHAHPLKDALKNGFISVEADVYLQEGQLLVSHDKPSKNARTLETLYLAPLDSIIKAQGEAIYPGYDKPFYLMIDCKTAAGTYQAILKAVAKYPSLLCHPTKCPVRIFLSGNRPLDEMVKDGYLGLGIDGRPDDIGKGYSSEMMPVISDHFGNWSKWKGLAPPSPEDLSKIKDLAQRVHADGKKLRLWAIPDNETSWKAMQATGVDFVNTDHLEELHLFLTRKGL